MGLLRGSGCTAKALLSFSLSAPDMALAALQAVTVTSQGTPCSSFVPWCSSHEWVMEELAGEGGFPCVMRLAPRVAMSMGTPMQGPFRVSLLWRVACASSPPRGHRAQACLSVTGVAHCSVLG